jgi:hypothetical protein
MSGSATIVNQTPSVGRLFEAFDRIADPSVSEFTSSIPESFGDLLTRVRSEKAMASDFILSNRKNLKSVAHGFHSDAGTLTADVQEAIHLLDDPTTKVVVSTHQPNLFAYAGVLKKMVLLEKLRSVCSSQAEGKVVNLFVIVDHDFIDENWIRIAQLPSINHSSGIMELRLPVAESRKWQLVCSTPVPAKHVMSYWKRQIKSWIKSCTDSNPRERKEANSKFEDFWQSLVEPSYSRAKSYSDLNSFMMSILANRIWGYSTVFVRISQMSRVFENGYTFLLSNFSLYSEALRGIEAKLMSRGIDTGVSSSSYQSAPVWLHCECGSKASAKVVFREKSAYLAGQCLSCKKDLEIRLGKEDDLDLSAIAHQLSPRAIPIPLLLSRDLAISCYCSGTGGIGYLVDGSAVAKKLALKFPLVAIWASKDKYRGIGQTPSLLDASAGSIDTTADLASLEQTSETCRRKMEPLLAIRQERIRQGAPVAEVLSELFALKQEQRRIRRQISSLSKAQNIAALSPCFVDYAVNFGMRRAEKIWEMHLLQNGSLAEPILFS